MMLEHVNCGQGHKALELFLQMEQGVEPGSVTFVGVLNAYASVVALEDGRCVHVQIIESGWDSNLFVGSSLVDTYAKCESMENPWKVINNVRAWRMLGKLSTMCHLKMWSLGMPYLEDVPCMGMVRKLLNILIECMKKVCSQVISLLFIFCQLVAVQVWWMKACVNYASMITVYNISAKLEHCTFLAVLAIYWRQRILSRQCPVNHMWLH
jgi:hypothetical protein